MHILIAEDDALSRRLLQTNLESMGHRVTATEDGQQALEAFKAERPDAIVSDWLMPNLNGLEFCKKVRQAAEAEAVKGQPKGPYTYFILLTANVAQPENYHEAMSAGVDDFLPKPLDRTELSIRLNVAQRILNDSERIASLEKLVTICAYTKKVKVSDDEWQTIEQFIESNFGLALSHGINPEYYEGVLKPELEKMKAGS